MRKVIIGVALLVVVLVALWTATLNFVVRSYEIPSESMAPTANPGDHILVNKLTYRFTSPQPGDVIVFEAPAAGSFGYESNRSDNIVVRWLQNALSFVGLYPPDENDSIKRVIAVGGQTVECRANTGLTVDGKPLIEPYLDANTMTVDPTAATLPVDDVIGKLWTKS